MGSRTIRTARWCENGGEALEAGAPPPVVPSGGLSRSELDKVLGVLQWIRGVLEGGRRIHHLVTDAMAVPDAWLDALPPAAKEIVGVHLYNDLSDPNFDALKVADVEGHGGERRELVVPEEEEEVEEGGGGGGGVGGGGASSASSPGTGGGGGRRRRLRRCRREENGAAGKRVSEGEEEEAVEAEALSGTKSGDEVETVAGMCKTTKTTTTTHPLPMTDVDAWQLLDALEKASAVWSQKRDDQDVLDQLKSVDNSLDAISGAASTLTFGLIGSPSPSPGPGGPPDEDLE